MAAMTLEPRDPDMSHFIDQYKFERQMEERRDKFGGGTSLPLNSDGYEDRKRFLREERYKDWVEQQEKDINYKHTINPYPHPKLTSGPQNTSNYDVEIQKMTDRYNNQYDDVLVETDEQDPVYYRLGTPEHGLPLGNYEQQRQKINLERQQDYNKMLKKQRKQEQDRLEQRRRIQQPPAQPQGHQIDYNQAHELTKAEDRRAYQDYQGKMTIPMEGRMHVKPPVSYEENKKLLAEERKREYGQWQDKKAKEERYRALRGRTVTPPGQGLDIGKYDRQVKEQASQKKKEYKDMLDQQTQERLKYRYWERMAESSPMYMKYRDDERPLVGSPRDINPVLFEKESRNIYEKDLKNKPIAQKPVAPSIPVTVVKSPVEDPNVKLFQEIERHKYEERKQYGEQLLKQQKEQMFMKAQQEPEMSVIDRKPPPGPSYRPREEPAQSPGFWKEGYHTRSPKTVTSEAQRRQRDDGVPLAFQTNTYPRPRSRGQQEERGYVPSLSDAPVRGRSYDERSRPPPRELLPPRTPPRQTPPPPRSPRQRSPPPRTPPQRTSGRNFEDPLEQLRMQPRSPSRRSPPPRTPPPPREMDQLNQNTSRQPQIDLSPRRHKYSDMEESQYDRMRKIANLERKEEYERYLKQKAEDRNHHKTVSRPIGRPAEVVKGHYYDSDNYESYQHELRKQQLDDYREYLKKNYQPPPGAAGLPLEQARYEPKRLTMEAERNAEYNLHLSKSPRDKEKIKEPQGLPLDPKMSEEKARWLEKQRNREYNQFLQKEQEARQFNSYEDIPNPFLPPPVHNPRVPEPYQTNPHIYQQSMKAPYPKAASAPGSIPMTPGKLSLPVGQYDDLRPFLIKQRNKDYNSYKEQLPPNRGPRITPLATPTAVSLAIGEYDEQRPLIEKQRIDEYNKLLVADKVSKKSPRDKARTPPYLQGLPIGQHHYEPLFRAMEYQRNKEYNDYLNKRFGQRTVRSEPDRADKYNKASFYLGNDHIHVEKRRFLEAERQKEYNEYLKQRPQPPSKYIDIPADTESGLPIGQQHHEVWKKFLREQRNREYNQLVGKGTKAPRNRNWKDSENGLLLPEDHSMEYKKRELQAERKREYNEHLAQCKGPPNHFWPEPDTGLGALWVKKGEYDGIKQMYEDERRKEFSDACEQRRQPAISLPPRARSQPNPVTSQYNNPMLDSMGRYEEFRKTLRSIRRKEFLEFMEKMNSKDGAKGRWTERRYGDNPPKIAREENPLVYSMGLYEQEEKKKREELHKDLAKFYEEQRKSMSPRRYQEEMPRLATAEDPLVNHMGNYDREKEKYILQRHKDFRDFSQKYKQQHHSPWNNFVYPVNAYLEHPVVEKMGHEVEQKRRVLRDERKRDYERYLNEKRMQEVPRRDDYGSNVSGPYNGMFQGLGEHGNQKDVLSQQRRQEYNEQYSQREKPQGRPSWAKDPVMDEPGDVGRQAVRSPAKQPDNYEQMLQEKRREEAQRRRFDDPEYQDKLARMDSRDRRGPGLDQPRYGY